MPDKYPLEAILDVRNYREDAAKRNLTRAQLALKEAQEAKIAREKELEQWKIWRVEETDRRYAAFLGKLTVIEKIDNFNRGLALLADEEVLKVDAVHEAQNAVEKARVLCENAKEATKNARKNTAKIETHKEIWTVESKKEAERKEDLELEEFKPVLIQGAEAEESTL